MTGRQTYSGANLFIRLWILIASFVLVPTSLVYAQNALPAPTSQTTEQKVDQLLQLLAQPDVQSLLASRSAAPVATPEQSTENNLDFWLNRIKQHFIRVAGGFTQVLPELADMSSILTTQLSAAGTVLLSTGLLLMLAAGLIAEWIARKIIRRRPQNGDDTLAPVSAGETFASKALPLLAFSLAVLVVFVALPLPPLLTSLLLPWLMVSFLTRFLLQDRDTNSQLFADGNVTTAVLRFWYSWAAVSIILLAVAWAITANMHSLGMERGVMVLVSDLVVALLVLVSILVVWTRPVSGPASIRMPLFNLFLTFYSLLMAGLWIAGIKIVFWLGLYAVLLPLILPLTTPLVRTLFIKKDNGSRSSVSLVLIDRGLRLTIIGAALLWLTYMIDLHPNALPDGDVISRILVGAMRSIIILLVADLFWQLAKAYINRKLELASQTPGDEAENARNSRLQTLLPILRNMLSIVIAMVAIMMALSELGVQIAPLIASAGIFGIALGFGSQTLVKDIISGIFYMVDDAFRIGEYIQSGSYKGTVESFSIRSVKLRHHRGPIFTVPFGTLGAVENMSRDWSIDKFLISVSYNTNLNLVKSVVKKIGAELLLDPELGPSLIETVKLKGVEQFGDYGITLGFGMTVKPGGQPSIIRRRAYAMIREAFIENGIEFASPMVQVAQGKDSTAAAAALSDVKMHQKSAADDGDGTTT